MTPEQQIKALAELDGWKRIGLDVISPDGRRFEILKWENVLPQYLTSYDAIIPLIQKLEHSILLEWEINWKAATPAQLCETLLREKGKWVE